MTISLSDIAVPTFLGGLTTLKSYVDKASAHTEQNKLDPSALFSARLYPDMFTFSRQIQAACDIARRGMDRVVGKEPSSVEDNEASFADLAARVESTITHVKAVELDTVNANADTSFTVSVGGMTLPFNGRTYVVGFAIPNFMFHVATAHDLLRHNGVDVGKRDFLAPFVTAVQ